MEEARLFSFCFVQSFCHTMTTLRSLQPSNSNKAPKAISINPMRRNSVTTNNSFEAKNVGSHRKVSGDILAFPSLFFHGMEASALLRLSVSVAAGANNRPAVFFIRKIQTLERS